MWKNAVGITANSFVLVKRQSLQVSFALVLVSVSAVVQAGELPSAPLPEHALARAAAYLWQQQAADGAWHSPQYGVLRSGQALTPFVLHALLQIPAEHCRRPPGGVERALDFIRRHIDEDGALGRADPDVLEYPIYSTAYALRCFTKVQAIPELRRPDDRALIHRICSFLRRAQFDDDDGFTLDSPAFGGWGFDVAQSPGQPGHMDLAHTRRALEAIRACPDDLLDRKQTLQRAQAFLRVVQKQPSAAARTPRPPGGRAATGQPQFDGGFYFSPVVLSANKGRMEDAPSPHWRSYATATCDGILSLLAAGVETDDPRVIAAADWLKRHTDVDYPQGVPTDHSEPWGAALRFYHYSVRAEVYAKLGFPADDRAQLAARVATRHRPDGSFVNDTSPLMKEDDAVLCTALALVALAHCRL